MRKYIKPHLNLFITIMLFFSIFEITAQSSTQNYILTTVPYQPVTDPTTLTDINSSSNSNTTIQYFDGLGRPVQTVQKAITPGGANLVSGIEYDGFGRDYRHWIPREVSGNSGAYLSDFTSAVNSKLYATTEYESSPLNRTTGQYGAGSEWYSAGKKKTIDYTINGSNVKHFYVDGTQLKCDGSYAGATLYGQKITDEDGKTTEEFTDKLGRKVLSRMAGDHDTYYVFDDLNNLRYVLPPMAADGINSTADCGEGSGTPLSLYGYIYHYDGRKRCTEKKLPGCDWIYMVYDLADRLILSQDGNQRLKTQWTANSYDIFGRLLYSGVIASSNNRSTMESSYSGSITNENYSGSGPVAGYTNSNFTLTSVLTVNYYDNYGFLTYSGNNPGGIFSSVTLTGYDTPDIVHTKTLLTGTRIYHLDNPGLFEVNAIYYDKYGRVVQTRATNHLEGYDIVYNSLDFTGKPTRTYKTHGIHGASATITELYTYTYDKGQRLGTTTHSLNGATPEIMAVNSYDGLGRLSLKTRHNAAESIGYSYNIRNWITAINNSSWIEKMFYQDAPGNPLYNGNIALNTLTYSSRRKPIRGYIYTYDELNRLTKAISGERTALHAEQHKQDEYFGYDKMGNITSIQRRNNGELIDDLILHYNGNQLQKGDDSAVTYSWYNLTDYTNYSTNVALDYLYDANGNMTQDFDKDIVTIRYNVLNLPDIIQFKNGNQVINTYTANGQKLRTKYYTAISSVVNPVIVPVGTIHAPYSTSDAILRLDDYMGNILYENGTSEDAANHPLTKVLTPEGYVDYATPGKPYCYFRKDHLGSIHEVDSYQGNNRTVVQKTQYYPSGTPFQESYGAGEQPYKFTGKEMITMHGLNWQDYGARWLDNARLQFTSVDPLAELTPNISPYAYCKNNPINMLDPTGMWTETDTGYTTNDPNEISDFFNQQKNNNKEKKIEKPDPINDLIEKGLNWLGLDLNPENPKDRAKLDDGSKNRVDAAKEINEVNKFLIINGTLFFVGEGVAYCIEEFGGAIIVKLISKEAIQAAEQAAEQGNTVLGKFPEYMNLASEYGTRRFSVPTNIWNKMSEAEQWGANQKFLNRLIARGDKIILSNPVSDINKVTGAFRKELDYLIENGYRLNRNGTQLIK